jgi:hypothetical protein
VIDKKPGEAAAKDAENAKKVAKVNSVKEKKRLKAKGFIRNKKIGFVFPGIDPKQIAAAIKNKKNMKKIIKAVVVEPKMAIGPINTNGSINLDFNTEMIAPAAINQRVY